MPETLQYTVEYRNVKHPRCEFKTGSLLIILPKTGWTPQQVLEKYRNWIKRKQATIDGAIRQTNGTSVVQNRTDKELRTLVCRYAETAQRDLNTKIHNIYFREMKTKWASNSQNNNLTVNTLLKFLPEQLVRYIIFHETAHNLERKHNGNFWRVLERSHPQYKDDEKRLLTYWFLIQKSVTTVG